MNPWLGIPDRIAKKQRAQRGRTWAAWIGPAA